MIYRAVFLSSCAAINFEILLTRVFSIGQWNHLSFMVISIALFGFAASGTLLTLQAGRGPHPAAPGAMTVIHPLVLCAYSGSQMAAFTILNRIPLDYFRLPIEPRQMVYLTVVYVGLALPFFWAGFILARAYAHMPHCSNRIYFWSMTGSAAGALLVVLMLPVWHAGRLIVLSALLPLLAWSPRPPAIHRGVGRRLLILTHLQRWTPPLLASALIVAALFLLLWDGGARVTIRPSPYKALSQALQMPDSHIVASAGDVRGRIDTLESPHVRHAPGLSLKYQGRMPPQRVLYTDADRPMVLYEAATGEEFDFAAHSLPFAGYVAAASAPKVLVIPKGGGVAVACALAAGSKEITIVEPNRHMANALERHYGLTVVQQPVRNFLARSQERYDVIQVDNWGPSLPGAGALDQESLLTVEALGRYLAHLEPGGVIIVSRRLRLPPADTLRTWAAAYEALRERRLASPADHLIMLRTWDVFTLLIYAQSRPRVDPILDFACRMNFDPVMAPQMPTGQANRFNIYPQPYHHQQVGRLARAYADGREHAFFNAYALDVAPQHDRRPFPNRFMKWRRLADVYRSTGSRFYSLVLSGEFILVAVFVEALVVAGLLLGVPIYLTRRRGVRPVLRPQLFFFGIGAGFMFAEIFFIKACALVWDDPVVGFALVLTLLLIFTAMGGMGSLYLNRSDLRRALAVLIGLLAAMHIGFDALMAWLPARPTTVRWLVVGTCLFVPGVIMGLFFPLGMRHFFDHPIQRAYAWAANGCASVLTSILAAHLALSLGIPLLALSAAAAYTLAYVCLPTKKRSGLRTVE